MTIPAITSKLNPGGISFHRHQLLQDYNLDPYIAFGLVSPSRRRLKLSSHPDQDPRNDPYLYDPSRSLWSFARHLYGYSIFSVLPVADMLVLVDPSFLILPPSLVPSDVVLFQ